MEGLGDFARAAVPALSAAVLLLAPLRFPLSVLWRHRLHLQDILAQRRILVPRL